MRVGLGVVLSLAILAIVIGASTGCDETSQPPTVQTIVLKGDPYNRGLQHGKLVKSHIRSLYTRLLTNSIVPYLNREQFNIAPVLNKYNDPQYQDGKFSLQMLMESGRYMKDLNIPEEYVQEMRGIADGAEMEFDQILALNTFFDMMMSFRSIVLFIQNIQHPYITSVSFGDDLDSDGFDNDGNTEADEEGENVIAPYVSSPYSLMLEVDPDATIKIVLEDPALGGLACLDPRNIPPRGDMLVDRSCIKEECISPAAECQNIDQIPVDCTSVLYQKEECSKDACLDNACAQVDQYPECYNNACLVEDDSDLDVECPAMTLEPVCYQDGCMEEACYPELATPDCYDPDCYSDECKEIRRNMCLYPRLAAECYKEECIELPDPACVNTESIRIYVNDTLYTHEDAAITTRLLDAENPDKMVTECDRPLEISFKPPNGFDPASVVYITLQAGDTSPIYSPEPYHNRNMRDERFAFTTKGYAAAHENGANVWDVPNRGIELNGKMPTSLAFAARGTATKNGEPLLAQHFALLDNDMLHEHSALFVTVPEKGFAHAYIGYTGIIWGFSGMNTEGLSYAFTNSDSLDNSLLGKVLDEMFKPENLEILLFHPDLEGLSSVLRNVRLLPDGVPIGISLREMLRQNDNSQGGLEFMFHEPKTYGWNILLADKDADIVAIEVDGGTQSEKSDELTNEDGFYYYRPNPDDPINLDEHGRLYSSITNDDIRISSNFRKNTRDMVPIPLMGIFSPKAQTDWTGFYYRSVRTYYMLGEVMEQYIGTADDDKKLDVDLAIELLRTPSLVDTRDSMNACVFEPAKGIMHYALGGVPASDQEFIAFDVAAAAEGKEGLQ